MALSIRSMLRRGAVLLMLGIGAFALLEVSARLYIFGAAGLIPERINSVRGLPRTGYTQPSADRRLGFELRPNLDGFFKLVPFRTNSRGLRDREYSLEKPPGAFRVVVVGSSFAMPAGVAIEDAFHSRLEEALSAELAPRRVEFLNFAIGMYNPEQVLAMLELRALAYDPDLILFAVTRLSMPWLAEDPASPAGRMRRSVFPVARFPFEGSCPILRSFLYRLIGQRTGTASVDWSEQIGILENFYMQITERPPEPQPKRTSQKALRALAPLPPAEGSVIERLAGVAERSGVPVALIRLEFEDRELDALDREVARQADASGIAYLDTRDAFQGTRASDLWIYALDPHPNAEAHRIFARRIDGFLRERGLLPGVDS
jgi:hypothetical protein